jgi:hypothetical protein
MLALHRHHGDLKHYRIGRSLETILSLLIDRMDVPLRSSLQLVKRLLLRYQKLNAALVRAGLRLD